jgi:hypothetical protein
MLAWCKYLENVMSELSKRSTVYFDPQLHAALRLKAVHTHRSLSDIVNEAVRMALREDQEDLSAFEERAAEPTLSYEELLEDLKSHGGSPEYSSEASVSGDVMPSGCC